MEYAATIVALGDAPWRDAANFDVNALSCVIAGNDFRQIKRTPAGSLLFVLCPDSDDPSLAAAVKVARIFRQTPIAVLPPLPVNPGPRAMERLERAARLMRACVVQPVEAAWADAVRCLVEPLAIFGLAGVDPREIHALVRPRVALLHWEAGRVMPGSLDVLVTCRLRPNASLRELDDAARAVAERAPNARLVLAGPEVAGDDGPRVLAASFL
jgi:hypothetical protein